MTNILDLSFKGSLTVLILVLCYKIYRMKITTMSKCCRDNINVETFNPGYENGQQQNPMNIV